MKDLLIFRGRNHYPQDIELTVEQSHSVLRPACGAAFAVEVEDEDRLVIAQEIKRSALRNLDVDAVVGAIRQAVSEEHELQVYAVLLLKTNSIPKTSSGKIQRHVCRTRFADESLTLVGEWVQKLGDVQDAALDSNASGQLSSSPTPQSIETIQDWLIAKLSRWLNVAPQDLDVAESFAYYGLDSSVAISLTGELQDWLGCELDPTLFWEYPNIEALARYLAQESRRF
jgi:acyl carrier protein